MLIKYVNLILVQKPGLLFKKYENIMKLFVQFRLLGFKILFRFTFLKNDMQKNSLSSEPRHPEQTKLVRLRLPGELQTAQFKSFSTC